jgi:hypothetical protein
MIEFIAAHESILKDTPIIPASKYLPTAMKDVPTSTAEETTIKNCPGILNYASSGYLICAHTDIILTARNDEIGNGPVEFHFEDPDNLGFAFDMFSPEHKADFSFWAGMFERYFSRPEMFPQTYAWNSPWAVKTPKDVGVYFLPVYYGQNSLLEVVPGFLDSYYVPKINPMFRIKRFYGTVVIPRGEPLLRVVPIRKETLDVTFGVASDKDREYVLFSKKVLQNGCPYKTHFKNIQTEIDKMNE